MSANCCYCCNACRLNNRCGLHIESFETTGLSPDKKYTLIKIIMTRKIIYS